jgi:hypothetical protein
MHDPEPQPGDGPEYEANHQYWRERRQALLPFAKVAAKLEDRHRRRTVMANAKVNPEPTSRLDLPPTMRRFELVRDVDVSGVSGTGVVAWGVQFPDRKVITRWKAQIAQTCVWDSIEDIEAIHGHGGLTHIVWLDA